MSSLMKRICIIAMMGMLLIGASTVFAVELPFAVYTDQGEIIHYKPSGRMGDTSDIKISYALSEGPYAGETCIRIIYSGEMTQGAGWAGLYWQSPANNWGEKRGGYDLTGATKLTFWVKGKEGSEVIEFKIGGIIGTYGDTDSASTGPIRLSAEWEEITLDVSELDMSHIIGGFCFSVSAMDNPDGATFYLDNIVYE